MTIFDNNNAPIVNSAIGNTLGYQGRAWDVESGLWSFRNRMYSPSLGRFLQRDPSGYQDGINLYAFEDSVGKLSASSLMNAYLYCGNDPVNYVDPLGLWSVKLGKWGLPLEIQTKDDPNGATAAARGPFAIFYGPTYRVQNPIVQETIRYHEYIHVGQWGWGFRDIWDKLRHEKYPSREMEAYARERIFIKQKQGGKCLTSDERKALEQQKQDVDFMIQNPQYMWQ